MHWIIKFKYCLFKCSCLSLSFILSVRLYIYFVFIGIRNPFSLRHLAFILFKYSHFFPCLFVFYFSLIVFIVKRKILFRDKIETYASFSNQMTGYINIIVWIQSVLLQAFFFFIRYLFRIESNRDYIPYFFIFSRIRIKFKWISIYVM